ncbi:MAG: exosortase/archaeosortase family protein [Desulfurococcaceae archaeon]
MKTKLFRRVNGINRVFIEYPIFVFNILLLSFLLKDVFKVWINYASLEMYSYLMVTPFVILILYIVVLKGIELNQTLFKYIYSVVLFSLGLLLIYASIGRGLFKSFPEIINDQILILGALLLLHSIAIYFGKENNVFKILLLTTAILIMIPPPSTLMFRISLFLTDLLLSLSIPTSRLLGLDIHIKESSIYKTVSIGRDGQTIDFNIAPICSGIIGLTSVLALSPILILIGLKGSRGLRRRLFAGVVGVLLFAVLMFFTNVLRLVLVFYFSSKYGVEIGYRIFHQTPEIVLAIPITFLVVKIIDVINGGFKINLVLNRVSIIRNEIVNDVNIKDIVVLTTPLILLTLAAIPLGSLAFASTNPSHYIYTGTYDGPVYLFNTKSGELEEYVPTNHNGINIRYFGRLREFEEAAGETNRIHYYRGYYGIYKTLDVYVEFADKPSDIHVWELCLPVNEINITYWTTLDITNPDEDIVFNVREIHYVWGRVNGLLIYWRDKVYSDNGLQYYRVTVMVNSYSNPIEPYDRELVYKLAEQLVLKNIQASFVKHARSIINFDYYVKIYIPIISCLVLTYTILSLRKNRDFNSN